MAFQRRLANPTCTRPLAAIWRNSSFMKERRTETPPRISHTSNRHPPDAFAEFDILRKDNKLCDIVLNVGGRRIFAHKLILCACSPYFKAMFLGELLESTQKEVNMKDIDEDALETIVDFCYTSSITVDENNVQTLLPAASLLQMTEVQNICCEFLQYQLDPSNCLGIRAFADIHSCLALRNIADKFIRANFKEVVACEEFLSLSADDLESIIAKDELNIFDEEQVFDAIILWAKHNAADRKQYLFKMLRHVRLHLINPKTLVKKVGNDTLVRTDESCRDLVEKAKNYHLLPDEKPTLQGPRIRPRVVTRRDRRYQPKPYYSGGLVVY